MSFTTPLPSPASRVRSVRFLIYVILTYAAIFWNTTPRIARVSYDAIVIGAAVHFDVAKNHDFTMEISFTFPLKLTRLI
jgi:hypothetical protein